MFDKFADWVTQQNIAGIGLGILIITVFFGAILKTAWGIWKKPD